MSGLICFWEPNYRFVKAFIRRNKTSLRRIMELRGYDPRYTETLIRHMEQYGVTGGFDVLETNYTQEMLEPLKKRKLIPEETRAGDPITDGQAAGIRAAGLVSVILARDENGNPVTGPELTVHHKVAVQDSGEKTNFAEVNQFKNLCLIIEPYHFFAHSLDRPAWSTAPNTTFPASKSAKTLRSTAVSTTFPNRMRLRTNALQTVQQRSVGLFPQQTAPARKKRRILAAQSQNFAPRKETAEKN